MKIIINGTLWVKKIDLSTAVISIKNEVAKKVGIQISVEALAKGQKKTAK